MKTTTLINETKNTFEERDKNTVLPFYQDSGAMFYKNKLINAEEIVEHYEMNTDDNSEFEAYSSKICYLLTFEDDKGNIHKHTSSVKPKNVGAIYYYIIKDGKLKNIFPEKDRKKLKPYISVNIKYDNKKSKLYSFTSFIQKHPIKIFSAVWFILSALIAYALLPIFHNKPDAFFVGSIFSSIPTAILVYIIESIHKFFNNETESFITQKENEERECILKTFI